MRGKVGVWWGRGERVRGCGRGVEQVRGSGRWSAVLLARWIGEMVIREVAWHSHARY